MKIFVRNHEDDVFGMANINPKKSGLPVIIWSDHSGVTRSVSHRESPRIKIGKNDVWVVTSIESNPKILAKSSNIKKNDMQDIQEGIEYVGRNSDLFLRHYRDTTFDFDDEDLYNALRERGDYR